MSPARVGVDAHVLDGKFQGSRTWVLETLRRAPLLAPDLTFVVYSGDPAATAALLGDLPVEHRTLPPGGPVGRNLRFWPRAIRADGLDVLVTQYFSPPRHPDRQLVVVHDVLFETHPEFFGRGTRWRNRVLVGWSARRAGTVATVSEYSRTQIERVYGRPARDVLVVHNGVDVTAATAEGPLPAQVPAGTRYALMVGRLEPRKNLRLALEAFARVADPDVRLVVVGRDDFEEPATLALLAAEPRAIHLTDVPQDALWSLYAHACAFVFPSRGEGWGIPVLEALAAGTPVLASDATAIPEAGGDACTYLDVDAPDAARTLGALLEDAFGGTLPFDAAAARAHVARFGWDSSAAELVAALRHAVARRTRGRG
ncbi:glycosyltransferase family 4 protein [Cellulomonas fimi]|uniref:Glycosyl transferase group 1 n=1 Tax=Cellulomonas fimi (strain ATCC 484 / DSM 20113 / JCM 1341 / CCUG 24087 / LMG 16345 / NBRC 15513 / NCIMB 8980 / NCTC 7547 / NRS-133) TaxID=590998 RepID=F4GZ47_CELFA|nr:glycosyltransferase family 1 protein [Cellulomonas fimi]AEE47163.1 glycosyl transferase group 1 [Cellulomonas fimi ATCC 484]NNH07700.1 glycosyltransferase family 4 protein [Cellulomonas fimi]VEH35453.1 GDP-mannose-dependent alpha-(1-2)-phosphatidylinositol mannosyltransferase [Cellulomonas fimi]